MKPKTKRIIAGVIAGILALLMILPFAIDAIFSLSQSSRASAASTISGLNKKLNDLDKQKQDLKDEIQRVKNAKQGIAEKKETIDKQINITVQEISTINSLISELNNKMQICEGELTVAEKETAEKYKLFKQRVRAMEESGRVSYISVILSADSFSNLLSRAEIINDVVSHDRTLIKQLKAKQSEIAIKKQEIEKSRTEQQNAKNQLAARKNSLNEQNNQANSLMNQLKSEQEEYEKALNEADEAQNKAKAEIKKLLAAQNSGNSTYVGGTFMWPVPSSTTITSPYGMRRDPFNHKQRKHTGIDIAAPRGTPIVAANSGTVIVAGWSAKGYGNYVVINHGGGKSTLYAHQSQIAVSKGDKVTKGQTIGYIGSTGNSTGPHLHFEVLINGDDTNPMNYFRKG